MSMLLLTACLAVAASASAAKSSGAKAAPACEADVTPTEDLMREHGVLRRVLLVYGEVIRRIDGREEAPLAVVKEAAGIVRSFIEDYHERLEEQWIFPRFEKAGKLTELVRVLLAQHQQGRELTDQALGLSGAGAAKGGRGARELAEALRQFIRLYAPHAAREDTVLFPALRDIVSPCEFAEMGDTFEAEEQKRFGEGGFERIVARVDGLERQLGIEDLSQFSSPAR